LKGVFRGGSKKIRLITTKNTKSIEKGACQHGFPILQAGAAIALNPTGSNQSSVDEFKRQIKRQAASEDEDEHDDEDDWTGGKSVAFYRDAAAKEGEIPMNQGKSRYLKEEKLKKRGRG